VKEKYRNRAHAKQKKLNDEVIVQIAVASFHWSVVNELEQAKLKAVIELEDERLKAVTLQSKLNLEERRRIHADECLKEERSKTKKLQSMAHYYKCRLKNLSQKKVTVDVDGCNNKEEDSFDALT
jgi:BarA-like signal transduction histidine kinase